MGRVWRLCVLLACLTLAAGGTGLAQSPTQQTRSDEAYAALDAGDYRKAYDLARPLADEGLTEAQTLVAYLFETGKGVDQSFDRALHWYRKAADQGSGYAMNSIGLLYDNGSGVPEDDSEAVRWYQRAADLGSPEAENNLGYMYEAGTGVAQDYVLAAKWYRSGAAHGYAQAQANLGYLYASGLGVERDDGEAVRWYRKAAAQQNISGQYSLAYAYETGAGVTQDYAEAFRWYQLAAEQGDSAAQFALSRFLDGGLGVDVDHVAAFDWLRKSGDLGYLPAITGVGYAYEMGLGTDADMALAVEWYTRAAELGHAPAQYLLGEAYRTGRGIALDLGEAARLFQLGADQNDPDAQRALGDAYSRGEGVAADAVKAVEWWLKAAELGNVDAARALASAYATGTGVAADPAEASRWRVAAGDPPEAAPTPVPATEILLPPAGCVLEAIAPVTVSERRVALVIGNGAYPDAAALPTPACDAHQMRNLLSALGFDVLFGVDVGGAAMRTDVREFARRAAGADMALVYFSGHALHRGDETFLLPVDARIERASALDFEAVSLSDMLRFMTGAGSTQARQVGIVLLDASRPNPGLAGLIATTPSIGSGPAAIISQGAVLGALAAAPGETAADGTGPVSPFTAALLDALPTPGAPLQTSLMRASGAVEAGAKAGDGVQAPWLNVAYAPPVILVPAAEAATSQP